MGLLAVVCWKLVFVVAEYISRGILLSVMDGLRSDDRSSTVVMRLLVISNGIWC